jgi:inner membrane protein
LWPLARVQSLVSERQALQAQAYEVIAAGFGGAQVLGAPVLSVDTQERTVVLDPATKSSSETWARGASRHLLPDDVRIDTRTTVEVRSKGIYSVPVYVSKVVITGEFKAEAIAALLICGADTQALPAQAVFQLPVSGVKYLRNLTRFDIDGQPLRAANGEVAGFAALSTPMDLRPRNRSNPLMFRLEFEVAGGDSFARFPRSGAAGPSTRQRSWQPPLACASFSRRISTLRTTVRRATESSSSPSPLPVSLPGSIWCAA